MSVAKAITASHRVHRDFMQIVQKHQRYPRNNTEPSIEAFFGLVKRYSSLYDVMDTQVLEAFNTLHGSQYRIILKEVEDR